MLCHLSFYANSRLPEIPYQLHFQSILSIDILTVMSDHEIVHCGLNDKNPFFKFSPRTPSDLHKFDTPNFNKADWPPIDKLSLVGWQDKFSTASVEESQKIF